jgi:prevent-host-death family protein
METVGAYEAKTNLARLLERVQAGEQITITRHGVPIAVLRPAPGGGRRQQPARTIAELRKFRGKHTLGGQNLKEMIEEGRR